ncbi:MAG: RNase III inhibitor, partial [Clostridiales bacterium]|nr:RNase III inhibitor [Clostridiales bacterium]
MPSTANRKDMTKLEVDAISQQLLEAVDIYIGEHYTGAHGVKQLQLPDSETSCILEVPSVLLDATPSFRTLPSYKKSAALDDLIGDLDEPFSEMLLRLIDAKEMTDVEVYKRANLDRKLFSKIRTNRGYMPSKRTAISLAIALELSLEETEAFLRRAGFALSHAVKADVIVEYFIVEGKYNIFEINKVLFEYD